MLPPKSLGLLLVASVYATATHQTLSNLYDACEFTLGRSRYDLCPLFHDRGHDGIVKVRAELSPITQSYYEISFGGPLKTQGEGEVEPQVRTGEATAPPARKWSDYCFSALRVHGSV